MWLRLLLQALAVLLVGGGLALGAYLTRAHWLPWLQHRHPEETAPSLPTPAAQLPAEKLLLTDTALTDLGIETRPVRPTTAWRTVEIPGSVIDRPGYGDRAVVAPSAAVVTAIHRLPGDAVRTGDLLFSLRVAGDVIQTSQGDLFKAAQDLKLAQAQRQRVADASTLSPPARLIEADERVTRLQAAVRAARLDLAARGLSAEQVDAVAEGTFVRDLTVAAPATSRPGAPIEVQEVKIEVGQQVQAGQTLALLADHALLAIEGRAFRDELPLLESSARAGWPVEVELGEGFAGDREAVSLLIAAVGISSDLAGATTAAGLTGYGVVSGWFGPPQNFLVQRIGNTLDPATRTVGFLVPLANQSFPQRAGGPTLWRYRPGQAARLHLRAERLDGVLVVPPTAVGRDGSEAYVFVQNVNTFERVPVRVLHQDRRQVVLAPGGELLPGSFVVQTGAEVLNRMVKAQGNTVPKGYHVHADGSLHKNEDEGN